LTGLLKSELTASGSNRIDSIRSDEQFSAFGFRIPAEKSSCLESSHIEKEYKSIYGVTFFNVAHANTKDSFSFLTMKNKSGNHITKYINDGLKSRIRQALKCEHENDQVVVLVSKNRTKSLEILGKLRLNLADLIDTKIKVVVFCPY
jgi:aspartyl-tRNA synthetase